MQINIDGGLNYQGTYVGATAYVLGDVVDYNGSSYVAIQATTGNLPTNVTYWQLIAHQGDTGVDGDTGSSGTSGADGDTGVAGDQGDTGTAGFIGSDGDTGIQGDTGVGDTGADSTVAGDTGTQGDTGSGDQGDTGVDGDTGTSGNQGDTGNTGAQGDQGDTGADSTVAGDTGSQGDTGAGTTGDTGSTGDTGVDSTVAGDTGTQGDQGDTGVESATAVTSTSIITDNRLVRGDGGSRGVQESGITISDADAVSGAGIDADNNTITNIGFAEFDTEFTDTTGIIDGLFFEKVDFVVVDDTGLQLDVEALGGGDLNAWIGGEKTTLDCTTGAGVDGKARLALTAGADANNPVSNYIYLTNSGGVASLNKSTSFPSGAFGWIGHVLLPDATTWATTGAYTIQRTTESFLNDSRGALSHEREKIRAIGAIYISGVSQAIDITVNGGGVDNVHLQTTQGVVKQMHDQTFPAFTTGAYYYGNGLNQFERITDLNAALSDSDGNSLSGSRFNLIIWGSVNKTTGDCKLFVNLPNGNYNKDDQAISDRDNTADQSIPPAMKGTAFLITRLALRHQTASSGTWTSLGVFSLLGAPLGAQAGGAGSIASNTFSDALFSIFDNNDPTKEVALEASGITAGNKRTLTVQDADGTIAYLTDVTSGDTGVQGDTGTTGAIGDTGTTGSQGDTGTQGVDGDTGSTGSTGAKGDTGNTGSQGVDGDTGVQGVDGDTGSTGAQGNDGDTGVQGVDGDTGSQGVDGDTGSSGSQGDTGTTGAAGTNSSLSKSLSVEDPTSSEDISMFFTPVAITITEMRAVLLGSATPSVSWTIKHHATDRSNAGNAVVTAGTTTTSTTAGSDVTSFDDATIPADSFVWLETTAQSGTVTEFSVTIVYTED